MLLSFLSLCMFTYLQFSGFYVMKTTSDTLGMLIMVTLINNIIMIVTIVMLAVVITYLLAIRITNME